MKVVLRLAIVAILTVSACWASPCIEGPYTGAHNNDANLRGWLDNRKRTWGYTDALVKAIPFKPPAGHRVRVLRLVGDLTARLTPYSDTELPSPFVPTPPQDGRYIGVLAAAGYARDSGSARADHLADDTWMYVQGDIGASGVLRLPFDVDLRGIKNTLLTEDNRLVLTLATYLNETDRGDGIPYAVHLEFTFSQIVYQFEKTDCSETQPLWSTNDEAFTLP